MSLAAPSLPALSATLRTAGAAPRSRTVRVACSAATQGSGKPTSNVVVLGASGYTGSEIVRLLHLHPHLKITGMTAESNAGRPFDEVYPQLGGLDLPLLVKTDVRPYASPLIDAAERAAHVRRRVRARRPYGYRAAVARAKRTACAQRTVPKTLGFGWDGGDTAVWAVGWVQRSNLRRADVRVGGACALRAFDHSPEEGELTRRIAPFPVRRRALRIAEGVGGRIGTCAGGGLHGRGRRVLLPASRHHAADCP